MWDRQNSVGLSLSIPKLSNAPKPVLRPIAIGAALRRLYRKAIIAGFNEEVSDYFTNAHPRAIQLEGGVEDGAVRAFKLIEALYEQLRTGPSLMTPTTLYPSRP